MRKTIVVTGAYSGIGEAILRHFYELDYHCVCLDLKTFDPVEREFSPERVLSLKCDVSSEQNVVEAFSTIEEHFGSLDILVNNSGLQHIAPLTEFPVEKWDLLINVMLKGPFLCSKEAVKIMQKKNFGRIVHISSIHGKVASPFKAAYISAKHGVIGLSKVIALEGASSNITSNCLCPGFVDTPLMRNQVAEQAKQNHISEDEVLNEIFLSKQEIKQLTSPEQVAGMVEFLASDHASTITGEAFNISGGWGMGR